MAHIASDQRSLWTQIQTPSGTRRRKGADGKGDNYVGSDGKEATRLEKQHQMLVQEFRQLFFSEMAVPAPNVLDVGFGTGIWDLEFLEQFPEAHICAMDIDTVLFKRALERDYLRRLVQRRARRGGAPLEQHFEYVAADATKRFPFADAQFDFCYAGLPDTFLSEAAWPHLISEMARVTRPAGWVEILYAGQFWTEQPSAFIESMLAGQVAVCQALNIAPTGEPSMEHYLQEAGITVYHQRKHVFGTTPSSELKVLRDIQAIIEGTRPFIIQSGMMSDEAAFDQALAQFIPEGQRAGFRMPFYSLYFRPEAQSGGKQTIPEGG